MNQDAQSASSARPEIERAALRVSVLFVVLALAYVCPSANADSATSDGITSFRADIWVKEDTSLEVREDITIIGADKFYRYGFIRNLPIGSEDRWDRRYVGEYKKDNGIRLRILEVTQDGNRVKYEQGNGSGYAQLHIGEKNVPPSGGEHRYTIRYSVDGVLNLGASRDTLYWNAIGHERNVPVAEAILSVHLPAGISGSDVWAEPRVAGRGVSYPRRPGTELERADEDPHTVTFRATHILPRQSLSAAVS